MRVAVTLEQCWHRVPGGTAVAAIETTRALSERGDAELVGVAARHRDPPRPPWQPPIPVRQLPLPRRLLYDAWHHLRWPPVQRATGPVDVVHATGVAVPPATAPLVVTVHDLAYLHDPSHFTARGHRFFRKALDLTRRHADLVLCSSTATMDDCAAAGLPAERLRLVPLGITPHSVSPTDADADNVKRRHGLHRYVLWVGTIEPRKNLPTLLEAFRRLEDREVTLALVGPEGWGEMPTSPPERVRVLGFQSPHDLAALYAGAAVFCYPSVREGFGLPVLEAMAHGAPVVTSAGTSTAEVAGDAALLVDPTDPDAIAGALDRVLGNPALAADLAERGQARAAMYTWERTAELTRAAYADVAR